MNPILALLIKEFRDAQDVGVATLINDLGIPQPTSGFDWVNYCTMNGLYNIRELSRVGIYTHGYGVELKIGSLTIDFDWGANGECDGFDGWRLYNFTIDNLPDIGCTHAVVNQWLEAALRAGELTKEDNLYYDPKRRAGKAAHDS
jgi:hypothetical protein